MTSFFIKSLNQGRVRFFSKGVKIHGFYFNITFKRVENGRKKGMKL